MDIKNILSVSGGVLFVAAFIPYVISILKDKTKTVSCNVDQNYRMWNSKSVRMIHDMKTPILRIDYYKNGTITH